MKNGEETQKTDGFFLLHWSAFQGDGARKAGRDAVKTRAAGRSEGEKMKIGIA